MVMSEINETVSPGKEREKRILSIFGLVILEVFYGFQIFHLISAEIAYLQNSIRVFCYVPNWFKTAFFVIISLAEVELLILMAATLIFWFRKKVNALTGSKALLVCGIHMLSMFLICWLPVPVGFETYHVRIDENTFPDEEFRWRVERAKDDNGDGELDGRECSNVTWIDFHGSPPGSVQNLKGIETFRSLEGLDVSWMGMTHVDVSEILWLEELFCQGTNLTELDLSGNGRLEIVDCSYNDLPELDVSQNRSLTILYCYGNRIRKLDLSQNENLLVLYIDPDVEVIGAPPKLVIHRVNPKEEEEKEE